MARMMSDTLPELKEKGFSLTRGKRNGTGGMWQTEKMDGWEV
jgi:hypothetical protein